MILQVANLKKNYVQQDREQLEVLRGVDLNVAAGERVALMGRSGSGKSTLISLLAGLDQPTQGTIAIQGKRLDLMTGGELNAFRARTIGIVFQQFHLLEHLNAYENVRLPMDLNAEPEPDRRAREVLDQVGLGHRLSHYPDQLSRGECQRVAIARVLVMHPALVLADEPTGSLDVKTGREVIDLMFSMTSSMGVAMVIATHDPTIAARCDRQLYVSEGQLTRERPAEFA